MILKALCELAQAEELIGDPDFEHKPVSWVVRLREDGSLVDINDHRRNLNEGKTGRNGQPIKPKWAGKDELVPVQPIRTSGDCAFFLVDKAEYVFGIDPNGTRPPEKLAARAALFREPIEACAAETDDAAIKAVAKFLQSVALNAGGITLPPDAAANDLFAFKVGEDDFVHLRPAVKAWWKKKREIAPAAGETRFRCLVTGEPVHDVGLFPLIKRVPGGTPSGVALVSHNAPAFESYGFSGNDNAPVSRAAAQAAATALNRLLDPDPINGRGEHLDKRYLKLSSDTVVVYWSPQGDRHALNAISWVFENILDRDSADTVADLYNSVRQGRLPAINDPSRLYAMTITGAQGRAIVRDWYECTVAELFRQLSKYLQDLRLCKLVARERCNDQDARPPRESCYIPKQLAQVRPPTFYGVCSATTRDPSKLPTRFALDWWRVAVNSRRRIPADVAARVLDRFIRAVGDGESIGAGTSHAAILKAWLIREGEPMYECINPRHPEPAYHCGRMMAVLAEIQRHALRQKLNAGVIRKYFGAVMSCPGLHLGRLHDLAEVAHLPKLDSDRRRRRFQDYMREIAMAIGDEVPTKLDLKGQSFFALGFYQQQSHMLSHPLSVYGLRTLRGEWVRSKPERAIANILRRLGVHYLYEVPLRMNGELILPDFLVPGAPGRPETDRYIEYLGMLDRDDYRVRWEAKAELYRKHGIAIEPEDEPSEKPKFGRMFIMKAKDFAADGEPDVEKMHRTLAEWLQIETSSVPALAEEGEGE